MFNSSPVDASGCILCYYFNNDSLIQVIRISNIPDWYFERVVFPGQRFLFEALPSAKLEVYTGTKALPLQYQEILCSSIQVI